MVAAGRRRHYLVGTYIIIRPEYDTLYSVYASRSHVAR